MIEANQAIDETRKQSSKAQFEAYMVTPWTDSRYNPKTDLIICEDFSVGMHDQYYLSVADLNAKGEFCLECFEPDFEYDQTVDQFCPSSSRFYRHIYSSLAGALLVGRELIARQRLKPSSHIYWEEN